MKKSIPWISAMTAVAIAAGCAAEEKTAGPRIASNVDPKLWACRSLDDQDCKSFKTKGTIPRTLEDGTLEDGEKLIHVANGERFAVLDSYVFRPQSKQWLGPFANARLEWVEGPMMGSKGCNTSEEDEEKKKRLGATDEPQFGHFVSDGLPMHVSDEVPSLELHYLRVYPMQTPEGKDVPYVCVRISKVAGGVHNGAVHGEGD